MEYGRIWSILLISRGSYSIIERLEFGWSWCVGILRRGWGGWGVAGCDVFVTLCEIEWRAQ
jgi:hypothetical protein